MSTRQNILENRETALGTIKTVDGFNYDIVIVTRVIKHFRDMNEYPSAVIFIINESRESLTLGYSNITADLLLGVRGIIKASEDLEDVVDDFAKDVEIAMCNDVTCGGYADLIAPGDYRPYQATTDEIAIFDFEFIVNYQYLYGSP